MYGVQWHCHDGLIVKSKLLGGLEALPTLLWGEARGDGGFECLRLPLLPDEAVLLLGEKPSWGVVLSSRGEVAWPVKEISIDLYCNDCLGVDWRELTLEIKIIINKGNDLVKNI